MPPTPDDMLTAVSDSLAARTGKSLEQWIAGGLRAERLTPAAPVVSSTVTYAAEEHRAIFA